MCIFFFFAEFSSPEDKLSEQVTRMIKNNDRNVLALVYCPAVIPVISYGNCHDYVQPLVITGCYNQELPGSIPGSAMKFSLKEVCPTIIMDWMIHII